VESILSFSDDHANDGGQETSGVGSCRVGQDPSRISNWFNSLRRKNIPV
jgi:hypothetical protein